MKRIDLFPDFSHKRIAPENLNPNPQITAQENPLEIMERKIEECLNYDPKFHSKIDDLKNCPPEGKIAKIYDISLAHFFEDNNTYLIELIISHKIKLIITKEFFYVKSDSKWVLHQLLQLASLNPDLFTAISQNLEMAMPLLTDKYYLFQGIDIDYKALAFLFLLDNKQAIEYYSYRQFKNDYLPQTHFDKRGSIFPILLSVFLGSDGSSHSLTLLSQLDHYIANPQSTGVSTLTMINCLWERRDILSLNPHLVACLEKIMNSEGFLKAIDPDVTRGFINNNAGEKLKYNQEHLLRVTAMRFEFLLLNFHLKTPSPTLKALTEHYYSKLTLKQLQILDDKSLYRTEKFHTDDTLPHGFIQSFKKSQLPKIRQLRDHYISAEISRKGRQAQGDLAQTPEEPLPQEQAPSSITVPDLPPHAMVPITKSRRLIPHDRLSLKYFMQEGIPPLPSVNPLFSTTPALEANAQFYSVSSLVENPAFEGEALKIDTDFGDARVQFNFYSDNPDADIQHCVFVMAGRGKNGLIPVNNAHTVLVVSPNQESEMRRYVGPNLSVLVMTAIQTPWFTEYLPEGMGFISLRRMATFYFAKHYSIRHFMMIDDNLQSFYFDPEQYSDFDSIYNGMIQLAQNEELAMLSCDEYSRYHQPNIQHPKGAFHFQNKMGAKLFLVNMELIADSFTFCFFPDDPSIWGEDLWMQFYADELFPGKVGRLSSDSLLFARAATIPSACKKTVSPATKWLEHVSQPDWHPALANTFAHMQQLVKKHQQIYTNQLNKIYNMSYADFTNHINSSKPFHDETSFYAPQTVNEDQWITGLSWRVESLLKLIEKVEEQPFRPNQIAALASYADYLLTITENKHDNVVIKMPTGTGKTFLIAVLALLSRNLVDQKAIAIISPSRDLVGQTNKEINLWIETLLSFIANNQARLSENGRICLKTLSIKQSTPISSNHEHVSQKMIQHRPQIFKEELIVVCERSFINYFGEDRQNKLTPLLVLADECHTLSEESKSLLRTQRIPCIGFSATPGEDSIFDFTVFDYLFHEAVADNVIARPLIHSYQDTLLKQNVEYKAQFIKNKILPRVIKQGLITAESIAEARKLEEEINDPSIKAYHSGLTSKKQKDTLDEFKKGNLKALITVDMLVLGFDSPIDFVCILRKMKPDNFMQIVGRSLRLFGVIDKQPMIFSPNAIIPPNMTTYIVEDTSRLPLDVAPSNQLDIILELPPENSPRNPLENNLRVSQGGFFSPVRRSPRLQENVILFHHR